jgi:nitric-oxide synthase
MEIIHLTKTMDACPLGSPKVPNAPVSQAKIYEHLKPLASRSLLDSATAFLNLLEREPGGPGVPKERRTNVEDEICRHGFYTHSDLELLWGCRFAWRHSVRCIGRFFWRQLEVSDARNLSSADSIASACRDHLKAATNGGAIRPLVTVFPALQTGSAWRIWNYQLVRYAGYRGLDGAVLGDPAEADFTEQCQRLGWLPPESKGRFDILPLVISCDGCAPKIFELPSDLVLEVPLTHPEFVWFKELGLRWYAVPVVSNMLLEIGGVQYPVLFNGWYMGTEIGARNRADMSRYDLLPEIARRMGILERREAVLWRDRALVELNRAVLHSYREAGVRIIDHHTAAQLHVRFEEDELAQGRPVTGLWDWLVPPLSGSTTPLWQRQYDPCEYSPNFHYQANPWD